MKGIYIYTGPVKSGKSTLLLKWIENRSDVAGILSVMFKGRKHLYSIVQKEMKCLECDSKQPVKVGRYIFDNDIFKWGQVQLLKGLDTDPKVLVVDEIGFLELKGEGLEPAFSKILNASKQQELILLLVIRDSLVERVVEFYKLDQPKLISDLNSIDD